MARLRAAAWFGGAGAPREMLNANIHASDTYAFYQAKYIRHTLYQISAAELELLAGGGSALCPNVSTDAADLIKKYRDTAPRIERYPKRGQRKQELLDKAHEAAN